MIFHLTGNTVESETGEREGVIFLGRKPSLIHVVECIIKRTLALVKSSAFQQTTTAGCADPDIGSHSGQETERPKPCMQLCLDPGPQKRLGHDAETKHGRHAERQHQVND